MTVAVIKDASALTLSEIFTSLSDFRLTSDRRLEVYLRLNKILQDDSNPETGTYLATLQTHLQDFLLIFQHDCDDTSLELCKHLTLRSMSHFLFHPSLARAFNSNQRITVLKTLAHVISSTSDCVRINCCTNNVLKYNIDDIWICSMVS